MKLRSLTTTFIIVLVSFAAVGLSLTTKAGAGRNADYGGNSHFVIWRAPDFGTLLFLVVEIDGQPLATLSQGSGYEAVIRPGVHTIVVSNSPSPYGKTRFFSRRIMFTGGQTQAFKAFWDSDQVIFEATNAEVLRHRMPWIFGG
jgi:hypothetical protein